MLAMAVAAVLGLVVSLIVALQEPVSDWEISLTVWINGAPDAVATALHPIMQLGTVIAPLGAAVVIALWRRDLVLAAATLVVGFVTWLGAKAIKSYVDRGRPKFYVETIDVREGTGEGLGFVSGHSAVAAATAVMVAIALPPRWRPVAALVAVLVGIARIVHGVHLPADVIGGWSFGVLTGLLGVTIVDAIRRPEDEDASASATPT